MRLRKYFDASLVRRSELPVVQGNLLAKIYVSLNVLIVVASVATIILTEIAYYQRWGGY